MENEGIDLAVTINGVSYPGRYTADRHGIITVWHADFGQKVTQRGGANTLATARSLLKQLVREGLRARNC